MNRAIRKPCPSCPWRLDQDASDIPGFDLEQAERLVATTETDLAAPVFACHQSYEGKEVVCAGWLARYGWESIHVRLGLASGRYTKEMLEAGPGWPPLHETFEEVIQKLRATHQGTGVVPGRYDPSTNPTGEAVPDV